MWLITPVGFFSIVQKPTDRQNNTLTVRARVRSDLLALKRDFLPNLGPVHESLNADYRFRAVAPRADIANAMVRMVEQLNYDNFKSEVARKQGHRRAGRYHQVWDVLYELQADGTFEDKGVNDNGTN